MNREKAWQLRQSGILLITAVVWGVAFVAQSVGGENIGPFTLIAIRFLLGAATLLPMILLQEKKRRKREIDDHRAMGGKLLLKGGVLCGLALGTASSLQQIGIVQTTVGKAGFLTAMYIVIVPVLGIVIGKKPKALIWLCVAIACAGIYFLSMPGGRIALETGDAFCLACAFVFAVQIMLVDHYVNMVDGLRLSAVEFLTASAMGAVMMLIFERPTLSMIADAAIPLLYLGVMSSGVGYTLQVIGQRGINPSIASLIMSQESTVSVIAGFLLLNQSLTLRELGGCVLMGAAIVMAQLV